MKTLVRKLLDTVNLIPTRSMPFVSRRHPYRARSAMMRALGPELRAEVDWPASDELLTGELASIFFATDDVHKWAHYLSIYESVIDRSRPINMLEIGVFHGGSLRMWRQYLHPGSTIVGVDIDPECRKYDDPAHGVHVRIGSQADTSFLRRVTDQYGPFDLILDDGSHLASHMVESFRCLFPNALVDGGIYVVEDVHCNYWKGWRDRPDSFVDFVRTLIDAMHAHYHLNDSEVAFRVGDPRRQTGVKVPLATTLVGRIEFFDSVAIIHRSRRELPRCYYR